MHATSHMRLIDMIPCLHCIIGLACFKSAYTELVLDKGAILSLLAALPLFNHL